MKKTLLIVLGSCLASLPLVRVRLVAKEPEAVENLVAQVSEPVKTPERAADRKPTGWRRGPTVSPYLNLLTQKQEASGEEKRTVVAPPANEARDKATRKMVEEASKAYAATLKAYEASQTTLEAVYNWSRRWMSAAMNVTVDMPAKRAAVDAHLERMVQLQKRIKQLADMDAVGGEAEKVAAVDYFIAEAERQEADLAPLTMSISPPASQGVRYGASRQAELQRRGVLPLHATTSRPAGAAGNELRYDGKTFADWSLVLLTDLSVDKRREAVAAVAEFGAHGHGVEAAKLIIEIMGGYSVSSIDGSTEGSLKQLALDAFRKIPRGEAMPALTDALKNGNANQRLFALSVLSDAALNSLDAVPLFLEALNDKDAQCRMKALNGIAILDHNAPGLLAALRAALAATDRNEVILAIRIARGLVGVDDAKTTTTPWSIDDLVPELIGLLGHNDPKIQREARMSLERIGGAADEALAQAADSDNAEIVRRASEVLKRIRERSAPYR